MSAIGWVRAYELMSAVLVLGGLVYVVRARNALYGGLYLGSAVGGGVFEWIFDTRWYFNLTADPRLVPLWEMGGVYSPLAMVFFDTFRRCSTGLAGADCSRCSRPWPRSGCCCSRGSTPR